MDTPCYSIILLNSKNRFVLIDFVLILVGPLSTRCCLGCICNNEEEDVMGFLFSIKSIMVVRIFHLYESLQR